MLSALLKLKNFTNGNVVLAGGLKNGSKFISARNFSEKWTEPGYGITPEIEEEDDGHDIDPSTVRVPYFNDKTRMEMYLKNKEEPKKWSTKNLAIHYKSSPNRIIGILALMSMRHDYMTKLGFEVSKDSGDAHIPEKWQMIYDKHKENKSMNFAELAESMEMTGLGDEVAQICKRMTEHENRHSNLVEGEKEMAELLDDYEEAGVTDARVFKETSKGGNTKWRRSYFPKLLADEDVEEEKNRLMAAITNETKAVIVKNFYYYVRKHSLPIKEDGGDIQDTADTSDVQGETASPEKLANRAYHASTQYTRGPNSAIKPSYDYSNVKNFSRTKIAFRDISFQNYHGTAAYEKEEEEGPTEVQRDADGRMKQPLQTKKPKNRGEWAVPPPTMILTKGGFWRRANPYEESQRSWTRHPTHLDLVNPANKERVSYFRDDWDGDDALVKAQQLAKQEKKRAQMASAGKKLRGKG